MPRIAVARHLGIKWCAILSNGNCDGRKSRQASNRVISVCILDMEGTKGSVASPARNCVRRVQEREVMAHVHYQGLALSQPPWSSMVEQDPSVRTL